MGVAMKVDIPHDHFGEVWKKPIWGKCPNRRQSLIPRGFETGAIVNDLHISKTPFYADRGNADCLESRLHSAFEAFFDVSFIWNFSTLGAGTS